MNWKSCAGREEDIAYSLTQFLNLGINAVSLVGRLLLIDGWVTQKENGIIISQYNLLPLEIISDKSVIS